jgi:hypothetical protein
MPEQLREDLQKKSEASRQTMPSMFAVLIVAALANSQIPNFQQLRSTIPLLHWTPPTTKVLLCLVIQAGFTKRPLARTASIIA